MDESVHAAFGEDVIYNEAAGYKTYTVTALKLEQYVAERIFLAQLLDSTGKALKAQHDEDSVMRRAWHAIKEDRDKWKAEAERRRRNELHLNCLLEAERSKNKECWDCSRDPYCEKVERLVDDE